MIFNFLLASVFDLQGPITKQASSADTIYISTTGRDNYYGFTPSRPVKTLQVAIERLRTTQAYGPKNRFLVFEGGEYNIKELNPTGAIFTYDVNTINDNTLTIRPYNSTPVVIVGNRYNDKNITALSNGLWKIAITKSLSEQFYDFYLNDQRMFPARFPKRGTYSHGEYNTVTRSNGELVFQIKDTTKFITALSNVIIPRSVNNASIVTSVDNYLDIGPTDKNYIKDIRAISTNMYSITSSVIVDGLSILGYNPLFVNTNLKDQAASLCTVEGEFVVSKEFNDLFIYVKPYSNLTISSTTFNTFEGPSSKYGERFVDHSFDSINGNFLYADKTTLSGNGLDFNSVSNVVVKDLNFKHLNKAISNFNYCRNFTISGCDIRHCSNGVHSIDATSLQVYKNLVFDIDGSGILIQSSLSAKVANNIIKYVGMVRTSQGRSIDVKAINGAIWSNSSNEAALTVLSATNNTFTISVSSITNKGYPNNSYSNGNLRYRFHHQNNGYIEILTGALAGQKRIVNNYYVLSSTLANFNTADETGLSSYGFVTYGIVDPWTPVGGTLVPAKGTTLKYVGGGSNRNQNFVLEHNFLEYASTQCISIRESMFATISGNYISSASYGSTGGTALYISAEDIKVSDNQIQKSRKGQGQSQGFAVYVSSSAQRVQIKNNIISRSDGGLSLVSPNQITVTNNIIERSYDSLIPLAALASPQSTYAGASSTYMLNCSSNILITSPSIDFTFKKQDYFVTPAANNLSGGLQAYSPAMRVVNFRLSASDTDYYSFSLFPTAIDEKERFSLITNNEKFYRCGVINNRPVYLIASTTLGFYVKNNNWVLGTLYTSTIYLSSNCGIIGFNYPWSLSATRNYFRPESGSANKLDFYFEYYSNKRAVPLVYTHNNCLYTDIVDYKTTKYPLLSNNFHAWAGQVAPDRNGVYTGFQSLSVTEVTVPSFQETRTFWNSSNMFTMSSGFDGLVDWEESSIFANPKLTLSSYQVANDSPALGLGFTQIDVQSIGLLKDSNTWVALASTLQARPIYGSADWADYTYYNDNDPYLPVVYNNVDDLKKLKSQNPFDRAGGNTQPYRTGNIVRVLNDFTDSYDGIIYEWANKSIAVANDQEIVIPDTYTSNLSGRWIHTLAAPISTVNISRFGAVGDGVTDDAPAIREAILYCTKNNIQILQFNSGTYFLSSYAPWSAQYGAGHELISIGSPQKLLSSYPKVELTLLGSTNGTTTLSATTNSYSLANGSYSMSIIGIGMHIKSLKIRRLTLIWDGGNTYELPAPPAGAFTQEYKTLLSTRKHSVPGEEFFSGIMTSIADRDVLYAGAYAWPTPIDIEIVEISNCVFINCHRAITWNSTCQIPGRGVLKLDIKFNTFLYPKGTDLYGTPGHGTGNQITYFDRDIAKLYFTDNFVEGTTYTDPPRCQNEASKDGCITFLGLSSVIARNTFTRMWIETIQATCVGPAGFAQNWESLTIPSIGQTLTAVYETRLGNPGTYSLWQKGSGGSPYAPGNVVSFTDGNSYGGGVYRVDRYVPDKVLVAPGHPNYFQGYDTTSRGLSAVWTRIDPPGGAGVFADGRTGAVGKPLQDGMFVYYNFDGEYNTQCAIIDNIFEPGITSFTPAGRSGTLSQASLRTNHGPCVRSDNGTLYLSGNYFTGGSLSLNTRSASPFSKATVEYNNFHIYDYMYLKGFVGNYSGSIYTSNTVNDIYYPIVPASTTLSSTVIRQNNFHFWQDLNTGGISLTANTDFKHGFGEFALHADNNDLGNVNVFVDNTTYCYVPALSSYLLEHAKNNYRAAGRNNIVNAEDILSGNKLVNVFPDYVNVSSFGAKGDGVTDDQPAIQRALSICSLNNIPTIYFSSGVYYLSSTATGTGTPNTGNGIGVGAGDHLNIGYYPEATNIISYATMYNNINYKPTNPKKISLNLVGTGTTILSARKQDRLRQYGGQASIIALRENINNFKMEGLTLVWSGSATAAGSPEPQGVIITSNYGRAAFWPINRNQIDILNCTFINCHGAISSYSSILTGKGTNTVNIIGCNFRYPKGSDSKSLNGGGVVTDFRYDTLNLNITDNFAEGSTTIPVDSPNYYPKDLFIVAGGVNNRYERNTMARFYQPINASTFGPGISITTQLPIPPVGGTITLSALNTAKNPGSNEYLQSISILSAYQGFAVGNIVTLVSPYAGVYVINSLAESNSNRYIIVATRLSGADYGGEFANIDVAATGSIPNSSFLVPFNFQNKINCGTYIYDNIFTAGLAISSPTNKILANQPAIGANSGFISISGNSIPAYQAVRSTFDGTDFRSECRIERNTFYSYSAGSNPAVCFITSYQSSIVSNKFYFWSDFLNNNSLVLTKPAEITSGYGYGANRVSWAGVDINSTTYAKKQAYPSTANVGNHIVANNIFYCTYALSANNIIPVVNKTTFDIDYGNIVQTPTKPVVTLGSSNTSTTPRLHFSFANSLSDISATYTIQVAETAPTLDFVDILTLKPTSTETIISNYVSTYKGLTLKYNSIYWLRVLPRDKDGVDIPFTSVSDSISSYTVPNRPAINTSSTVKTTNAITINWAVISATLNGGIKLYYNPIPTNNLPVQATIIYLTNTDSSYTVTGLNSSTGYNFKVAAYNLNGAVEYEGPASVEVSIYTNSVPPPANSKLTSLTLNNGTLTPNFAEGTTTYNVSVPATTTSITTTPTVIDSNATVKVNGVTVASGMASVPLDLVTGSNSISIEVTVTNESTTIYTVVVIRAAGIVTLPTIDTSPSIAYSFVNKSSEALGYGLYISDGGDFTLHKSFEAVELNEIITDVIPNLAYNSKYSIKVVYFNNQDDFNIYTIALPAPTITLATSTPAITRYTDSTLTWSTTNAQSVTIDSLSIRNKSSTFSVAQNALSSGSLTITPSATTTYTIRVLDEVGETSTLSTTLLVVSSPIATLSASISPILTGASSTITWSTTYATSAFIDSRSITGRYENLGRVAITSGSLTVSPSATTSYTISAFNAAGTLATACISIGVCKDIATTLTLNQSSTSVTQYGITWTFDRPYRVGQFINGDWWVVGPVIIKDIDPKTGTCGLAHGTMLNPKPGVDRGEGLVTRSDFVSSTLTNGGAIFDTLCAFSNGDSTTRFFKIPTSADRAISQGLGYHQQNHLYNSGLYTSQEQETIVKLLLPLSQGFGSFDVNYSVEYDSDKNISIRLPYTVSAGNSIYSVNCNPLPYGRCQVDEFGAEIQNQPDPITGVGKYGCYKDDAEKTYFKETAVLTVLSSVPLSGSFRPPYAGSDKTIQWNISNLDYSVLRKLTIPIPDHAPTISWLEDAIKRPLLEMNHSFQNTVWKARWNPSKPGGYTIRTYGREIGGIASGIGLILNSNFTNAEKEKLLIYMVQWGIDINGLVNAGMVWGPNGGHQHGRSLPLFIAAKVLNSNTMLANVSGSKNFQELIEHGFVEQEREINTPRTLQYDPGPIRPYTQNMLGMPEWNLWYDGVSPTPGSAWVKGKQTDLNDGIYYDANAYRQNVGGVGCGTTATIIIMNGRSDLNQEAFIRYHTERYFYKQYYYAQYLDQRRFTGDSNATEAFVTDMWDTYIPRIELTASTPAATSALSANFAWKTVNIYSGNTSTITWAISTATYAVLTPTYGRIAQNALSGGTYSVSPTVTTTYTLSAVSLSGVSNTMSVTLSVLPTP